MPMTFCSRAICIFVDDVIQRQNFLYPSWNYGIFRVRIEKNVKQSELKMKEVGFLDFIFNEIRKKEQLESKCFMNTDIEALLEHLHFILSLA